VSVGKLCLNLTFDLLDVLEIQLLTLFSFTYHPDGTHLVGFIILCFFQPLCVLCLCVFDSCSRFTIFVISFVGTQSS
jgi:hypothetical protein